MNPVIVDYIEMSPDGGHNNGPVEVALRVEFIGGGTGVLVRWQAVGSNPLAFRAFDHDPKMWKDAPCRSFPRASASRGIGLPSELPHFISTRVVAILADIHWQEVLLTHTRSLYSAAQRRGHYISIRLDEDEAPDLGASTPKLWPVGEADIAVLRKARGRVADLTRSYASVQPDLDAFDALIKRLGG